MFAEDVCLQLLFCKLWWSQPKVLIYVSAGECPTSVAAPIFPETHGLQNTSQVVRYSTVINTDVNTQGKCVKDAMCNV